MMQKYNVFPRKWLLVFLILLVFSLMACTLSFGGMSIGDSAPDETELAQNVDATITAIVAAEEAALSATAAAKPTNTPTVPPSPSPTASNTPIPTQTPTPTPEGLFIGDLSQSLEVDDNNLPINPSSTFNYGVKKIHSSFPYSGLEAGTQVKFYYELNGKEWYTYVITWDEASAGNYDIFIRYVDDSALDKGKWALKVYVDGKLIQTGRWVIQ